MVRPDHDAVASVHLVDAPTLELLNELLKRDPDDTGLAVLSGDPNDLAQGQTIRLQFNAPRRGVGLLLRDVAHLVEAGQIREPSRYFLINPPRSKDDPELPEIITRYRAVLKLIAMLRKAAAYLDESQGELIFFQNSRFTVPVRYTVADLTDKLPGVIDRLVALFDEDMHRDQKLAMLASAVLEAAGRVEPQGRFTELLRHLDDVTRTVTESYRLFCSNFSYEKVRSDIQDAHIEFTTKIHKTFSDIQSQLLGIPVATVIVSTQMKYAKGLNNQFWINTGILLGSAIFVVIFFLLVMNQRNTLAVLGDEIDRREAKIANDHKRIMDLFEDTFRKLRKRIASQKRIVAIVQVIVVLGFIATAVVYAYLLYLPIG